MWYQQGKTRGRADSCPISTYHTEAWVQYGVITSHSSLDLLVLNKLLSQGCVNARDSLLPRPFLPDSECGMGCGQLQGGDGSLRDRLQQGVLRLG
jgi:hypothetical protein